MEYMRTSLAFIVFWANLLFSTLNLYFSLKSHHNYKYLNGQDYFDLTLSMIIITGCSFLFIIALAFSFCFTGNECCNNNPIVRETFPIGNCYGSCLCCGNCDCECLHNTNYIRAKVLLLLIMNVFSVLYYSVWACGKHISRMVTIIALILINLTLFALSIRIGNYRFSVLLSVFSIFAAVGNFLAILLPNLKNCKQLSYNNPFLEEKIEQINQSPQKLIMIQSQNEKPLEEEAYPKENEVVKEPINKPITPNYIEQTQGYDDDNSNRSSIGAPAPAFI